MIKDSLTTLGIGFSVVFIGLLCLIGIIYLMSFVVGIIKKDRPSHKLLKENDVVPEQIPFPSAPAFPASAPLLTGPDRRAVIAAISAAVAESIGTDIDGIRITSIRPTGGVSMSPNERRELIAVISAAIASELGSEASGIKIHSIRKVS